MISQTSRLLISLFLLCASVYLQFCFCLFPPILCLSHTGVPRILCPGKCLAMPAPIVPAPIMPTSSVPPVLFYMLRNPLLLLLSRNAVIPSNWSRLPKQSPNTSVSKRNSLLHPRFNSLVYGFLHPRTAMGAFAAICSAILTACPKSFAQGYTALTRPIL